jgi:hypothetical protein
MELWLISKCWSLQLTTGRHYIVWWNVCCSCKLYTYLLNTLHISGFRVVLWLRELLVPHTTFILKVRIQFVIKKFTMAHNKTALTLYLILETYWIPYKPLSPPSWKMWYWYTGFASEGERVGFPRSSRKLPALRVTPRGTDWYQNSVRVPHERDYNIHCNCTFRMIEVVIWIVSGLSY